MLRLLVIAIAFTADEGSGEKLRVFYLLLAQRRGHFIEELIAGLQVAGFEPFGFSLDSIYPPGEVQDRLTFTLLEKATAKNAGTSRELPRTGENSIIKIKEDRGWPIEIRLARHANFPWRRKVCLVVALTGR